MVIITIEIPGDICLNSFLTFSGSLAAFFSKPAYSGLRTFLPCLYIQKLIVNCPLVDIGENCLAFVKKTHNSPEIVVLIPRLW